MTDNIKFWNKQADRFSKSGNNESKKLVEKSSEYLTSKTNLLDFACGTGQSTILFADVVQFATGLDYSDEMIRLATKNKKENTNFITGSLDHDMLTKNSYDVIVAFNVLHLIADLELVSEQVYKLLKPGGYFVSYSPCITEKKTLTVKLIKILGKLKIFPKVYPLTSEMLINKLMLKGYTKVLSDIKGKTIRNNFLVLKKEVDDDKE